MQRGKGILNRGSMENGRDVGQDSWLGRWQRLRAGGAVCPTCVCWSLSTQYRERDCIRRLELQGGRSVVISVSPDFTEVLYRRRDLNNSEKGQGHIHADKTSQEHRQAREKGFKRNKPVNARSLEFGVPLLKKNKKTKKQKHIVCCGDHCFRRLSLAWADSHRMICEIPQDSKWGDWEQSWCLVGLTCEELFLVVRGRLEDLKGGDGRVVQHCKESSQWHWHRAGDGTKKNACIAWIRLCLWTQHYRWRGQAGRWRQGRDITIHGLWVGSHRWKRSKHREWTQGKRRVYW